MDWNLTSPERLDWETLAIYGPKVIETPKQVGLTVHDNEGAGLENIGSISQSGVDGFSVNDPGSGSSSRNSISTLNYAAKLNVEDLAKAGSLHGNIRVNENIIREGKIISGIFSPCNVSTSLGEPTIALKLRTPKDDGHTFSQSTSKASLSSLAISSTSTKRSRTSYQHMHNPHCQVEGCNLDLSSAKDYHRRHRICEKHSKSPKVVVSGMERRFCQQCSRFHGLSEFDDKKRSCRRRLSDHNARRRRLQPESNHFNSIRFYPTLYDCRPQDGVVNRFPMSVSSLTGESTCTPVLTQATNSIIGHSMAGRSGRPRFSPQEAPNAISNLHVNKSLSTLQSMNPRGPDHCSGAFATDCSTVPDLSSSHSLLSTNSWYLNKADSASMTCLENLNVTNPFRHFNPCNSALTQSSQAQAEQMPLVSSAHSVNTHNVDSAKLQEFQLFTPYESCCFFSSRN